MVCRNENDSEPDAGSPSELPYYELPEKSTTSSSMDKSNDSASQSDTTPASASSLNCPRETSSPPHSPVSSDSPPLSPLYESYSLSPLSPVATGSTSLPSSATSSSSYPAAIGSSLPPPVTTGSATGSSSCLPVETGSSSSCPIATPGLSSLSPAATSCVKDSSYLLPWDSCSNSDHNEEGLFTVFKESLSPQQYGNCQAVILNLLLNACHLGQHLTPYSRFKIHSILVSNRSRCMWIWMTSGQT